MSNSPLWLIVDEPGLINSIYTAGRLLDVSLSYEFPVFLDTCNANYILDILKSYMNYVNAS